MAAVHADDGQVFFPQGDSFPMLNGTSQLRVYGINRPTAVRNSKIFFAPLEKGDKKEAEIGIDHKNGNAAVASAFFTDHGLPKKIKILPPLSDPADKYHKNTPFRMKILQIHFTINDLHDKITAKKRRKAKKETAFSRFYRCLLLIMVYYFYTKCNFFPRREGSI